MALAPGTRLGPYEILSLLGAGGMGEVISALGAGGMRGCSAREARSRRVRASRGGARRALKKADQDLAPWPC
jgi:hypothetical protein